MLIHFSPIKNQKVDFGIAIIYLKYKIFRWLFSKAFMLPTGPKVSSWVFLGPCKLNNQEAVYNCEIYVYKEANFTLAWLHCKETSVHICSTAHPCIIVVRGSCSIYREHDAIDYSKVVPVWF